MIMAFKTIETILIIFCFCFGLFSILFNDFNFTLPPRKIKKINFQKWENNRKKEAKRRKQKIIQYITEYLQSLKFKVKVVNLGLWSDFYFEVSVADSDSKTP